MRPDSSNIGLIALFVSWLAFPIVNDRFCGLLARPVTSRGQNDLYDPMEGYKYGCLAYRGVKNLSLESAHETLSNLSLAQYGTCCRCLGRVYFAAAPICRVFRYITSTAALAGVLHPIAATIAPVLALPAAIYDQSPAT
jgi:hypothetical protein